MEQSIRRGTRSGASALKRNTYNCTPGCRLRAQLNDHRYRIADLCPGIALAGHIQATTWAFDASSFAIQARGNNLH